MYVSFGVLSIAFRLKSPFQLSQSTTPTVIYCFCSQQYQLLRCITCTAVRFTLQLLSHSLRRGTEMSQETAKSKRARLAQELAMEEIAEFIESHGFYITEINQNSVVFLIPTFTPSGEEGELRAIAHSYKEARELLGY